MKTIMDMALDAGFTERELIRAVDSITRFAELVRADERDRAMRENAYVLAEREACAKAVLTIANDDAGNPYKQALRMGAEAIRARGNT